jgi:hypothetical protein
MCPSEQPPAIEDRTDWQEPPEDEERPEWVEPWRPEDGERDA